MAMKIFWSLRPGEIIFAEKLYQKFKNHLDLYFPIKDRGIDLLAVTKKNRKVLCFQIKESRYYEYKDFAWHQETKKKFEENKNDIHFYVFVIYLPGYLTKTRKKNKFVTQFVIVPTVELLKRIKLKKRTKGKYFFYFRYVDEHTLLEVRESKSKVQNNPKNFDYSKYLNAWNLIQKSGKF